MTESVTAGTLKDLAAILFDHASVPAFGSISISIHGADSSWDLFVFYLHLLFMGLAAARYPLDADAADPDIQMDITNVTADMFGFAQDRMSRIGVHAHLQTEQVPVCGMVGTNFELLMNMEPVLPLESYVFKFMDGISGTLHSLWFDIHRTPHARTCHANVMGRGS
jgi:hypothetical protein